ncbi:nitrilase-related carbon-nitrogen hydrolase [Anaeromyxobacter sp. SG64]|uniref:nitrilase-related carbon-nitrogen hydrolase n=1 Tax=Anaeromyxobacter sp. SG64 TaxID=2925409 RepID=UPI001F5AC549|nr:nitrilase-related carbon-nitrogen hydrolase [Anaeromyxobacter sp. SG64]
MTSLAASGPIAIASPAERDGDSLADRVPAWALSLAGIVLVFLAGNRGGTALLAWVAPVPLALAAVRLRGWRRRLVLLAVCAAALSLQSLKMVTPPVAAPFALLFGVPLGALVWLTLVLWDAIRRHAGAAWSILAFAALTALGDVIGFALSPAGHWAAFAASQSDNLPLLQLASLGGLGFVGFVMALPAGAAAALLASSAPDRPWRTSIAAATIVVAAHVWGSLRLDAADAGPTVRVAAVTVDFPEPLTSMEDLRGNVDVLFARSELAARRGAELVVWNEVATLVEPSQEAALLARGADFARREGVDLVLAYGVVVSSAPFVIDNAYVWLGTKGETLERYRKHVLPPGEPSLRGEEPLRVLDRSWGRAAGAICYDYDFPALARAHARGGAGVIALPSSDWRGIDPQHTLMARVRAIEGGMSVVRAVRAATSMAFDPYGRVRASLSAWERNERVMLATVPTAQVRTVYASLGDAPVVFAALALLGGAAAAGVRRRLDRHATRSS